MIEKAFLVEFIGSASSTLVGDFGYLPVDKVKASPGGVARDPVAILAECALFNRYVAAKVRGIDYERPSPEAIATWVEALDGDRACDEVVASGKELVDALEAAEDGSLNRRELAPWGDPVQLWRLVHIAGVHMFYHIGQVNYIQHLYGDGVNHWAETADPPKPAED